MSPVALDPRPHLVEHPIVGNAHDHRIRQRSADPRLIVRLRGVKTDRDGATAIVAATCAELGVPAPRLAFHARRRPETGLTRPPRGLTSHQRDGHIQLSATPTLGVIAHELGHHLVFHLDPVATPAHGFRWVDRYDEAAAVVARLCGC